MVFVCVCVFSFVSVCVFLCVIVCVFVRMSVCFVFLCLFDVFVIV